ncbi:MAG: UDP-2,3-diacylglucosamine hydrolase [Aestuariibacter sp.]|nr:UDP-2,3-diacylglucosamine hydrolase [Aestuariibacter sp.]
MTEPGSEPYISRILVTGDYLRMDQGQGDVGFILLNRRERIIYSVNPDDKTILQISPGLMKKSLPKEIDLQAKITEVKQMPELSGRKSEYWQFFVNDKLCRSAVVAPGLMPEAIRAYAEYLDLLAFQHLSTVQAIPAEMQDPCDLAVHVYRPLSVLDKGLPLREWVEQGQLQELIDYRQSFKVPDDSFKLPEDFVRTTLGSLEEES